MAVQNISGMLADARKNNYAVGAFVFYDFSQMKGMAAAAIECGTPIILLSTALTVKYMGIKEIVYAYRSLAEDCETPIALQLDHGMDYEIAVKCIDTGYTSVMIDGSAKPFYENIDLTKRVVCAAHAKGVTVEAELGVVSGKEDDIYSQADEFVNPGLVNEFVEKTGIDALAVGIGTAHGVYKKAPVIRFDLVKEIFENSAIPLVMHGGTGLTDDDFRKAVSCGISKINVGTEFKNSFSRVVCEIAAEKGAAAHPLDFMSPVCEASKKIAIEKMGVFGSRG